MLVNIFYIMIPRRYNVLIGDPALHRDTAPATCSEAFPHHASGLRQISNGQVAKLGDSKVQYLCPETVDGRVDDDVIWFEIAVNDLLVVCFLERRAQPG